MSIIRRRNHEVPGLNTASLPDLIFAIIFFFMIVTHMRKVNLKVNYKSPQGTELQQLARKTNTTYIFVGQPTDTKLLEADQKVCIQVNDKVVSLEELRSFLKEEQRKAKGHGEAGKLMACLKADRNAPMEVIESVKMALREANILNVNYYATERKSPHTVS